MLLSKHAQKDLHTCRACCSQEGPYTTHAHVRLEAACSKRLQVYSAPLAGCRSHGSSALFRTPGDSAITCLMPPIGGLWGGMQAGRLDSGSEVIWHGDVRLQTFKPYRQVAIFEDLQLWRSPSNTQLLLYKAPKLTLVLNVEMVTGTRVLLLNLSNMAGNSVMQLDFPWTVKLTGKYLRKQALVSLRMMSILRCSQELKLIGKHGEIRDQQVILKPGNVSKLYKAHKKRLRTKTDMRRLSVNL